MHYTGMAAATFLSAPVPMSPAATVADSALGTLAVTGTTIMILGVAILTSLVARHGRHVIEWIYDSIDLSTSDHQIVYL